MTETLLSPSNVLLFGRVVADLKIIIPPPTAAALPEADQKVELIAVQPVTLNPGPTHIDGVLLANNNLVILAGQGDKSSIYKVTVDSSSQTRLDPFDHDLDHGAVIKVRRGDVYKKTFWRLSVFPDETYSFEQIMYGDPTRHGPFVQPRVEVGSLLEKQLTYKDAKFARIYGFSYEGQYFDLARPILFLVHGDGVPATEARSPVKGKRKPSRAPGDPSLIGIAAAESEYADDVMVWSYDKADYTIRMDVDTGMFEQVLLDAFFNGGGGASGAMVSGAMVSGAMVGGPSTRGAMVRGAMVSGAMLRGRRGGRGDPSD